MPQYRTDDITKWGPGKGGPLAAAEVDQNFWELWQAFAALQESGVEPAQISNITVVGSQMTVFLDDGRSFGPYTLPVASMHWRGAWAPAANYEELDLVQVVDVGTFLVMRPHTSDATFDPNASGPGGKLYQMLMGAGLGEDALNLKVSERVGDYWLTLADAHGFVQMNYEFANGVVVPSDATTNFPVGAVITVQQTGLGQTTVWEEIGVFISTPESRALRKQYSMVTLIKLGPDYWTMAGDLQAENA